MKYLLVSILILTMPDTRVIANGIIYNNMDIFMGVYMPDPLPKTVWDSYLVFRGPEKRIEALYWIFRKLFDSHNLKTKGLVQVKTRIMRKMTLIVSPEEYFKKGEEKEEG